MIAPEGLFDDSEELAGLIKNNNNRDDIDGVELTDTGTWKNNNDNSSSSSSSSSSFTRSSLLVTIQQRTESSCCYCSRRNQKVWFTAFLVIASFLTIKRVFFFNSKNDDDTHHQILSPRRLIQIRNYRHGKGIIVNIHVEHHGGLTVSNVLGKAPNTTGCPSRDDTCRHHPDRADIAVNMTEYPDYDPWEYNKTGENVAIVRKSFHYLDWKYSPPYPTKAPLSMTNWEHRNLVSIYVSRDPMSILYEMMKQSYPIIVTSNNKKKEEQQKQRQKEEWLKFATTTANDNMALRSLIGKACCNGNETDRGYLDIAKKLIRRFTFIIDIDCLLDGLSAIANQLGIEIVLSQSILEVNQQYQQQRHNIDFNNETILFPEVHQILLERNQLSIELHEWAKQKSFVLCNKKKKKKRRSKHSPKYNNSGTDDWL